MVKDTPLPLAQAFDAAAVIGMVLSNRYGLRVSGVCSIPPSHLLRISAAHSPRSGT